jgi:hypothetical protein
VGSRCCVVLIAILAGCATSTERIASSTNEIHGLARSSGRRFEVIHTETGKPDPSIPTIRTQAEGGIQEQEQIMGLVDSVQVYLMNTTNITPWWASLLTYGLFFGSIACVAFIIWHLGLGKFIRGWLGLVTPAEQRQAKLAAQLIDIGGEEARDAVWKSREEDRIFDTAFRRYAPARKASARPKKKRKSP